MENEKDGLNPANNASKTQTEVPAGRSAEQAPERGTARREGPRTDRGASRAAERAADHTGEQRTERRGGRPDGGSTVGAVSAESGGRDPEKSGSSGGQTPKKSRNSAASAGKPGRTAGAFRNEPHRRNAHRAGGANAPAGNRANAVPESSSGQRGGRKADGNRGKTGAKSSPDNAAARIPGGRWTWRDYALQLSVVIIGIVVTFVGSGLIERWRVAREVRTTMLLVQAELESNRTDFKEIWDYQQWEMRACRQLTDNRRDLKRIPADSLPSYDRVYGRIYTFHPRRDAFELLKNSGLMSSVRDKDFLLTVSQGYAALVELEENVSMYFNAKQTAQNDMSRAFSEQQRARFYSAGSYETWECIFSVPWFAEFMLTAPHYFPEGYIEGVLADVDRSVRAIEAKYRLNE